MLDIIIWFVGTNSIVCLGFILGYIISRIPVN